MPQALDGIAHGHGEGDGFAERLTQVEFAGGVLGGEATSLGVPEQLHAEFGAGGFEGGEIADLGFDGDDELRLLGFDEVVKLEAGLGRSGGLPVEEGLAAELDLVLVGGDEGIGGSRAGFEAHDLPVRPGRGR